MNQAERYQLLLHIMNQTVERNVLMDEKKQAADAVKNVFHNGTMPTREEYTRLWIKMINQIEGEKADH